MGFPIRKFTDQSLFAAPRDLSQRTTSFIASQRQGIHRIPLKHLTTLIVDARSGLAARRSRQDKKDQFLRDMSDHRRLSRQTLSGRVAPAGQPSNKSSLHDVETARGGARRLTANLCIRVTLVFQLQDWWSQTGSNRRPHACKARALPTELWPRVRSTVA